MTTTTGEDQYLRRILALLDGARPYEDLIRSDSKGWQVQPGSALAGDDAKTNPYQVSHNAWNALSVAVDHLHCYRSTLVGEQKGSEVPITLYTHGQYSLLRGAFENSARAVWTLAPPKRLVRVQRRLSLQASEYRHSDHLLEVLQQQPRRSTDERMGQLTALIVAAGTPQEEAKKALRSPSYKDIVREAGALTSMGADQAEVIWSGCSSLAHGDTYGTLSFLDRNIVATEGRVNLTQLTSSPVLLHRATDRAVAMLQRGFTLFKERATCHR
ncbi:hypothetical protein [Streptomyces sp. NPDC096132]|uniref:hypothetical protein n=1 Tax=unclassified Streptomyces TaxID=2593676 RepID=UPI0037FF0726